MKTKPTKKKTTVAVTADPLEDIVAYNRGTDKEKRPEEKDVLHELYFDPHNPRLADTPNTGTQASILRVMIQEFDLQPLIDSMYRNGFF